MYIQERKKNLSFLDEWQQPPLFEGLICRGIPDVAPAYIFESDSEERKRMQEDDEKKREEDPNNNEPPSYFNKAMLAVYDGHPLTKTGIADYETGVFRERMKYQLRKEKREKVDQQRQQRILGGDMDQDEDEAYDDEEEDSDDLIEVSNIFFLLNRMYYFDIHSVYFYIFTVYNWL